MLHRTRTHMCARVCCAQCARRAKGRATRGPVQPPIVPCTVIAPGKTKSTVVQTCVSPGVQPIAPGLVFLTAHIFALYLPAGTHWSTKHAADATPHTLGFHCVSSQARFSPSGGID